MSINNHTVVWGGNQDGGLNLPFSLGTGTYTTNLTSGLSNYNDISIGAFHGLAKHKYGNWVTGWGANDVGQADVRSEFNYIDFDAATETSYLVDTLGRIHGHGMDLFSSGMNQPVALANIINWIYNQVNGSLPQSLTAYSRDWERVKGGTDYLLALRSGVLSGWGATGAGTRNPLSGAGLGDLAGSGYVVDFAAGYDHAVALISGGNIAVWGSDTESKLDLGRTIWSGIKVSSKAYHSLALGMANPSATQVDATGPDWQIHYTDTADPYTGLMVEYSRDNGVTWLGQTYYASGASSPVAVTAWPDDDFANWVRVTQMYHNSGTPPYVDYEGIFHSGEREDRVGSNFTFNSVAAVLDFLPDYRVHGWGGSSDVVSKIPSGVRNLHVIDIAAGYSSNMILTTVQTGETFAPLPQLGDEPTGQACVGLTFAS